MSSGPSLAFGLTLQGIGYHELDVPLDGREGRPTVAEIANGEPHHVAAVYDSNTGRKSLCLDGVRLMTAEYPRGTKVAFGGAEPATLGNRSPWVSREAFCGVIDEFAWYERALSGREIARRWEKVRRGLSYFGYRPDELPPNWRRSVQLTEGKKMRFHAVSGLPLVDDPESPP